MCQAIDTKPGEGQLFDFTPSGRYAQDDNERSANGRPMRFFAAFGLLLAVGLPGAPSFYALAEDGTGPHRRVRRRESALLRSREASGVVCRKSAGVAALYTVRRQIKRRYGFSGNSFVAAVEFGDRVGARAVTAGGESGDPRSPHFDDAAMRYSTGNPRNVYFYDDELAGHTIRTYRP